MPPTQNGATTSKRKASARAASLSMVLDATTQEERAAAAREYALSSTGSTNRRRRGGGKDKKEKATQQYQTPPIRPTPPTVNNNNNNNNNSSSNKNRKRKSPPSTTTNASSAARRKIEHSFQHHDVYDDDEEYAQFVKDLMADDSFVSSLNLDEDDDDEYNLPSVDEEDDDLLQDFFALTQDSPSTPVKAATVPTATSATPVAEDTMQAELGGLLEEELEAAVTTLLGNPASPAPTEQSPRTPTTARLPISSTQRDRLSRLLEGHYQLLIQQAMLAVRQAHIYKTQKTKDAGGESADDLAEILDGAVGMLQDLDQQRKDAIRNSIQLKQPSARRVLLDGGRLTRAAFEKTLQQPASHATTAFDICGLAQLAQTFATMDRATAIKKPNTRSTDLKEGEANADFDDPDGDEDNDENQVNILGISDHASACRYVLEESGANLNESFLPCAKDESDLLSYAKECFGKDFQPPCTLEQRAFLRRDRNQFTAAEDSLVFRGVNLYGEKQWMLIADRFLPDRSINIISQRYSKLSLLVFKAHGVQIDEQGNLETPPKHMSSDQVDKVRLAQLKKVEPPAILNVHRWSIEEDLTLLKAVPILGHMWAELSSRLIPHRDRGHLRKRYQVLERRVKATVVRAQKNESKVRASLPPPPPPRPPPPSSSSTTPPAAVSSTKGPKKELPKPNGLARSGAILPATRTTKTARKLPIKRRIKNEPFTEVPPPENLPRLGSAELDMNEASNSASNTRQGLETILNDSGEWSQLSKLKKLIDEDPESIVAGTAITSVGHSKPRSNGRIEQLPQLEIDSNTSSGLSLLNKPDISNATFVLSPPSRRTRARGPIIESVLKDSKPPSTPLKTPGTPNSLAFSPAAPRGAPCSPNAKTDFSPATPRNFQKFGFSPGFKPGLSPSVYMLSANSTDGYEFCNFQISDRSRQAFEAKASMPPPTSRSLFQDLPSKASLPASEEFAEAALALNSMSNSPAQLMQKKDSPKEKDADQEDDKVKRTLFENVIMKPQRKKQRTNTTSTTT